jgi:hypothetical protein
MTAPGGPLGYGLATRPAGSASEQWKTPWERRDAGGKPASTSRAGRDGRTNEARIIR